MVIETVQFRLHDGVNRVDFQRAVSESTKFLETCKGFIDRVFGFKEDGECFDLVLWETVEDGTRVWDEFDAAPENQAFVAAIASVSVEMKHFDVIQTTWAAEQ